MNRELENYFEKVTAGIPNEKAAEEIRMELEDHILTKAELLCLTGVREEEAVRQVLAAMGEPVELQEEFAEVHSLSFRKSRIVYESGSRQCRRVAGKISRALGIPYEEMSADTETGDEEVLILIRRGAYQGKCSPQIIQYIRSLQRKKIKWVICITLQYVIGIRYAVSRSYYWTQGNSYYSNYWQHMRNYERNPVIRLFWEKGVESVEEKVCFRDPLLLGWVRGLELIRVIAYLEKALVIRS